MIKKILNFKFVIRNWEGGMTYVELIVVLSIFATLSTVVMFNYSAFQGKIDIKNLSSDIALKITEAQKSSIVGRLPPPPQFSSINSSWRPSYGIYINRTTSNNSFVYFVDTNQNSLYDDQGCLGNGECLEQFTLTKGNIISGISVYHRGDPNAYNLDNVTISFVRPSGVAVINSTTSLSANVDYIQITVHSPKQDTALIKVYPSGKIKIN
jgi:type II secretory pathway pseudopilin PulG